MFSFPDLYQFEHRAKPCVLGLLGGGRDGYSAFTSVQETERKRFVPWLRNGTEVSVDAVIRPEAECPEE